MAQSESSKLNRPALIAEARRLVGELSQADTKQRRLASIVAELHADGMTYPAIAADLGWKTPATALLYERTLGYPNVPFPEAYALASSSPDRGTADKAIADALKKTVSTAQRFHRSESRAIAAEIADLPEHEKESVARELAHDPGFMAGALAERSKTEQQRATTNAVNRRSDSQPIMGQSIAIADLRLGLSKVEEAAKAIDSSRLDESDKQSINHQAQRARNLADYLEALTGVGDMDQALEELLS